MKITTLEPTITEQLKDEAAPTCDQCDNTATLIIYLVHGCIRLSCEACLVRNRNMLALHALEGDAPMRLTCGGCELSFLIHGIDEFVKSVEPL